MRACVQWVSGACFVNRYGAIAYAAQQPWILNATVQENIVFGQPFDEGRYKRVIHACALEKDLTLFAAGHATEIVSAAGNAGGGMQ